MEKKKITVAGMGYVGLSLAVLFAQHHPVSVIDPVEDKVKLLNQRKSPIRDAYIESFLDSRPLDLHATTGEQEAYRDADFVVIAVPTNYDVDQDAFDTSAVESVIEAVLRYNRDAVMVIKSTIPIGYTQSVRQRYHTQSILFSPEFLREGKALYDNLYPSRIIVGTDPDNPTLVEQAETFAELLKEGAEKESIETLLMGFSDAEAVKLFANSYLAMRISFFNELDTFAETKGLNTKNIIRGVCLDSRIGCYYNNPSFGYGGYCLPKDTRQLLASYKSTPETLIESIVTSNSTRKQYIVEQILKKLEQLVPRAGKIGNTLGIYRLSMKAESDNFRFSSILGVIEGLRSHGIDMILYEPMMQEGETVEGCCRVENLTTFKELADLVIANRMDDGILDIKDRVYTRDLFGSD